MPRTKVDWKRGGKRNGEPADSPSQMTDFIFTQKDHDEGFKD